MHPTLEAARSRYLFLDWDEIAAASDAGRAEVEAHPGDDELSSAFRAAGALLERGMLFKSKVHVNWRVAARAPRLSPAHLAEMEQLGAVVDRLLTAVTARLSTSTWLRERLGFPMFPQEELLLPWASRLARAFFRLDLAPDEQGRLRIIELQTISGGLGITQALREVYGPHPAMPGLAVGLDEGLRAAYRDFCAQVGKEPSERPLVGMLLNAESDFRHELLVLASALPVVEMVVGPWVRMKSSPFPSLRDGRVPDVLFRFFQGQNILSSTSSFTATLVTRVAHAHACMVNPWIDVLDDKRLLAAIHEEEAPRELGEPLTAADWAVLRSAVPETWRLDAARGAALKGRPRAERGVYLKKGRSTMSRWLVDGQQINGGAFDRAVDQAVAEGDWIAQRAVRGAPWPFTYLDRESGSLREMNGYVRLTPVYTRTLAGGLQLADACITARPQRSRVHGASDACVVVPVG